MFKKYYPQYKAWKTQSRIKPIKTGEKIGATFCLGCKDYTHNFKPQEVKMTRCLKKNQTVLFVDPVNQDFWNKNTTWLSNPIKGKNSFFQMQKHAYVL